MTHSQIQKRISNLIDVHAFTNIHGKYLTDLQRICLSQERAAWMSVLDYMSTTPRYVIPFHLEEKVTETLKEINRINWIKPEYEKDPY